MKKIFIFFITLLVSVVANSTGVAYVSAEKNVKGEDIAITGWEDVGEEVWSQVTITLEKNGKKLGGFSGECTRPTPVPNDHVMIVCRGPKDFPLAGSTYVGYWQEKENAMKYVCTQSCSRSAPKSISVHPEEEEGDEE